MKTLKGFLVIVAIVALAAGCSLGGIEKILPSKDGTWTSNSSVYRSYVNSVVDSTWTDATIYTYKFDKGGSVSISSTRGTETRTWLGKNDIVTLCSNTISGQTCEDYLVKSSSSTNENWTHTTVGAANGLWVEHDLTLTR